MSILDNDQCQDIPRKKRPRDVDIDPSDVPPQASPVPLRSAAAMRRVSPNLPSYVQQQQPPDFSLPMYSNELGRLPIYGQFQFSDSVPCIPVQSPNNFVRSIPGPMNTSCNIQGAYPTNPSFEGQTMGDLVDHNQGTSSYFAAFCNGDTFDSDILSSFGAAPAMDNATMAVWSAAPTNLECVFHPFFLGIYLMNVFLY